MEISFEPEDVQIEHIIRLLGNLTKSKGTVLHLQSLRVESLARQILETDKMVPWETEKVSYFYKKNHLNKRVNSMLYYPWNKAEMKKVENAIGRNQNYWKQQGVSKVTGKFIF